LRKLGSLRFLDTLTAQVSYTKAAETVTVTARDGKRYKQAQVFGATSYGEFGNIIIALVSPGTKTRAYWSHWEVLRGKQVAVFQDEVAAGSSPYQVVYGCEGSPRQSVIAAYKGFLFLDPKSDAVLRVTRMAQGLPPKFPTHAAASSFRRSDARGLYVQAGFRADNAASQTPIGIRNAQTEQQLNLNPLVQMADATGSQVFQESDDFDAGFHALSARPAVMYLLGFSPADGTGVHKLKVTVKGRRGLLVRARQSYIAEKTRLDAQAEVRNVLLSHATLQDIAMKVNPEGISQTASGRNLSLLIRVDPRNIKFQRVAGQNHDVLTFTFGVFNADGEFLYALDETIPLDFDDVELRRRIFAGVNIKSNVDLKPAAKFIRVVLQDAEGQLATADETLAP
jgi:hypothetical protein